MNTPHLTTDDRYTNKKKRLTTEPRNVKVLQQCKVQPYANMLYCLCANDYIEVPESGALLWPYLTTLTFFTSALVTQFTLPHGFTIKFLT